MKRIVKRSDLIVYEFNMGILVEDVSVCVVKKENWLPYFDYWNKRMGKKVYDAARIDKLGDCYGFFARDLIAIALSNDSRIGTIVHECTHASEHLLDIRNFPVYGEALAYTNEFIFNNTYTAWMEAKKLLRSKR